MEFEKVIRERISVRSFQEKRVEKEKLLKILEAGRIAPTAKNIQPQRIYVLEKEESIQKINDCSPCIYGARTVLLVCSDKKVAFQKGDYSTYEMDACIVATHMMLEATNLGVDNIWIEMFDSNKIKESFSLEEGVEPICLLPLGYQKEDYPGSINHNNRKSLEETVTFV